MDSLVEFYLYSLWYHIDIVLFAYWKGGWENDETVEEAALREAVEEAGVRGELLVMKNWSLYNLS